MKIKCLILLIICLLLVACGDKYNGDFSYEVKDFNYTNQDGESFSKDELNDQFWIANMIFTNCETVCPPMTGNMARLQKLLQENNVNAQLVSFSVDPENDTPEKLKQYAADRGASFDNWNLLTGYTDEEIKKFVDDSFNAFIENPDNSNQVIHQTTFYLVSPNGDAIKGYNGTKADNMKKIIEDIQSMN